MRMINKIYILCVSVLFILVMVTFGYGYLKNNNILFDKGFIHNTDSHAKLNDSSGYTFISENATFEDAINTIGKPSLKTYEYGDNTYIFVSESLDILDSVIVLYRYNSNEKKLYRINDDVWSISASGVPYSVDGWWFDYEIANQFIFNFDGDGYFIAGEHQNNDIYYGVWVGDEIKNISFKKGIFEYSLLGKANLENENAHNVYFWTYELGNSNELFSHILKNESNETSNNKLVCYAKDVKKLLGIKSKYEIDLRIGLYILITLLLLAITVFLYIVTFKVNGKESAIVKKVLLWLITFVLSAIVAFLIINFAYNPRLVYGECKGIGEIFYNITGHCFPNPVQCMQ